MRNKGRLIAIGDIHGCSDHLLQLLGRIHPSNRDRLVFLGDYVGHGPDVPGVINTLIDLGKDIPCVFLRGDHDEEFRRAMSEKDNVGRWVFENRGGRSTVQQYGGYDGVPASHVAFLENTELGFEQEGFLFVHAGLRPGVSIPEQRPEDTLWGADNFWSEKEHWPFVVVCGHWAREKPFFSEEVICLDTGAVFENFGHLTACSVRERVCVQARWDCTGEPLQFAA